MDKSGKLIIKLFVETEIVSNCYIIHDKQNGNGSIMIAPGAEDEREYERYLENEGLTPTIMLLTHRHFDHFARANSIREIYPNILFILLMCSEGCNTAIQNPRLNCSVFMNHHKPISLEPADKILTDNDG